MDRRAFRRYLKQNPNLQKWLIDNERLFRSNPQAIRSILENPSVLPAFNQALLNKSKRLNKRLERLERKQVPISAQTKQRRRRRLPALRLPSLSSMNEKLEQTSNILENIQSIMSSMK